MSDLRLLFVTAPESIAEPLVSTLVTERLVACANVIPQVRSTYFWDGQLCRETEAVLLMETVAERVPATAARIRQLHPYECPKIVVITPADVNDDYLTWARAQTKPH